MEEKDEALAEAFNALALMLMLHDEIMEKTTPLEGYFDGKTVDLIDKATHAARAAVSRIVSINNEEN